MADGTTRTLREISLSGERWLTETPWNIHFDDIAVGIWTVVIAPPAPARKPKVGEVWHNGLTHGLECMVDVPDREGRLVWKVLGGLNTGAYVLNTGNGFTPPAVPLPAGLTDKPWRAVWPNNGGNPLGTNSYASAKEAHGVSPSAVLGALNVLTGEWRPK